MLRVTVQPKDSPMKQSFACFALAACLLASAASADYSVSDIGAWPSNWPKELEPLRKTSGTIQGSLADLVTHHVPFNKREEFEAAWPHLLKIKTKGAPVILLKSPAKHWHFKETKAGVLIHTPSQQGDTIAIGEPTRADDVRSKYIHTIYIELVVDGNIVDLNRIKLPDDGPVVDERFQKEKK
jgi:hypothetical protein